jgi:hypothetical protein
MRRLKYSRCSNRRIDSIAECSDKYRKQYAIPARRIKLKSALIATGFQTDFLLGVYFDPENGGDIFLRNVS